MTIRQRQLGLGGLVALALFGTAGCETMNNTEKGVLAGGAIGAGAGTLIGAVTKNPKTGAVVGGLLGAGVGGLMGNDADKKERRQEFVQQVNATRAYDSAQPGRIGEVIDLVAAGTPEQQVVNHLKNKGMTFDLSAADIKQLNENRVPARVVETMQSSRAAALYSRPQPVRVVREEVIVREPVYIGQPGPVMIMNPYAPPGVMVHGRW